MRMQRSAMPLFVVLREGYSLDQAMVARIKSAVRVALSPRHVPNDVFQVSAIPRTLSGKKMELPVKKLLLGAKPESVLKRDAMANADSVDWFVDLARRRQPVVPVRDVGPPVEPDLARPLGQELLLGEAERACEAQHPCSRPRDSPLRRMYRRRSST